MPITAQQRTSRFYTLYTTSKRLAWDPAAIDLTAGERERGTLEALMAASDQILFGGPAEGALGEAVEVEPASLLLRHRLEFLNRARLRA